MFLLISSAPGGAALLRPGATGILLSPSTGTAAGRSADQMWRPDVMVRCTPPEVVGNEGENRENFVRS